jgi:16S rRNA (cytosine967-C5)-methyltransferase
MRSEEAAARALALILPALAAGQAGKPPADARPADALMHAFFRDHPALGKRDRTQVADLVFDVLRNLRLYRELAAGGGAGGDIPLPALVATARTAMAAPRPAAAREDLPEAVRYSLPDWIWARLREAHGDRAREIAAALLLPAPVDLRVNLLRGKATALRDELARRGIDAEPVDGVPTALRLPGRPALERLDLFERGWFEIQDAGSQWIADACAARRGQLVVDFCAGAGGKTLALAARMRNAGRILAFDTSAHRLAQLAPRARRAGVEIVTTVRIDGPEDARLSRYRRRADLVLVDAPCSGTGTLARSPELKWRLTPERLDELVQLQRRILVAAAELVKPGGTLVYATCSLLREENHAQAHWFGGSGPVIGGVSAGRPLAGSSTAFQPPRMDAWLPDGGHASGFFVAKWLTRPPA